MILKAILLQVERVYVCVYVYISYMIQLVEMIDIVTIHSLLGGNYLSIEKKFYQRLSDYKRNTYEWQKF